MVEILIYLSLLLIVLSLLMMLGFGLRTLIGGRKNYAAIGSFVLAGIVFLIAWMITSPDAYAPIGGNVVTKAEAAIVLTAIVMFGLGVLALIVSAARSLIK